MAAMAFPSAAFRMIALGAVLSSGALGATVARAADGPALTTDTDEAKARFAAGRAFYEKGEYQKALAEFQAGFALTRTPAFLINSALCHKKLGNAAAAREDLESFMKLEPNSPRKAEVDKLLAELGPVDDSQKPVAEAPPADDPAAAGLLLRQRAAAAPPPSTPRAPAPSRSTAPTVAVAAPADADEDGEPLISTTRSRSSAAVATAPAVKRRAEPVDDESEEDRADKPVYRKAWFWGVVGGAVLAGIAGAFLATRGSTESGTLGTIDARVR